MSVTSRYLLRLAIEEALKEKRRRKWRDRFRAVKAWWQNRKGKATIPTSPTTVVTVAGTTPTPATTSTLPAAVQPAKPWALYSVLALAGIASLGMIVYGSSLFSRPSTSSLATTAAIAAGVLTLTIMLAAYLTYLNKNGPIRWRQPVTAPPTPPPAPGTPTATGATPPPTPPPPASSINWKWVGGVVALLIFIVGVVGIIKFWPRSTTPTTQTAVATPATASVPELPVAIHDAPVTIPVILRENDQPYKLTIPPRWRWEMLKPIPTGWTTDSGYRDSQGNRIQIFEVVPPAAEVKFDIVLSKCKTPQECAW